MKNDTTLFFGFTPYHIRLSNYFAETKYSNHKKYIFITEIPHTKTYILDREVKKHLFEKTYNINFNFKGIDFIKDIWNYKDFKDRYKNELEKVLNYIDTLNPKYIVLFADDLVPYQIIINYIKHNMKECKIILIEEGTARYISSYKKNLKIKIKFIIDKFVYGNNEVKLIHHGQNNNIDIAVLREPELISYDNKNIEKLKIDKNEFKNIILYSIKKTYIEEEKSVLFVPTKTTSDLRQMKEIYNKIFEFYYKQKKHLYFKLHPAEVYVDEIYNISKKYSKYIHILTDKDKTSDDYILNKKFDTVLSDYSSTLINACYLREDIEILTYEKSLKDKYNVESDFKLTIFEKFLHDGKIKQFKI